MVATSPNDFSEMVGMGVRLEEGIREGRLSGEGFGSGSSKRYNSGFNKKKDGETNYVARSGTGRPRGGSSSQQIAAITPVVTPTPAQDIKPQFNQQQRNYYNQQNQNRGPRRPQFEPIPMTYAELYPYLLEQGLVQPREAPKVPEILPWSWTMGRPL